MGPTEGQIRGWKEIASHLDVSERTAKRWETTRGLPVPSVHGASRDAVFARHEEIQAWLAEAASGDATTGSQQDASTSEVASFEPGAAAPASSRARVRRFAFALAAAGALAALSATAWYVSRREGAGPGTGAGAAHTQPAVSASGRPALVLLELTVGGSVSRLGVRDGGCARVETPGVSSAAVCARRFGDGLVVNIGEGDGSATEPAGGGLYLKPNTKVRMLRPVNLQVEWVVEGRR